MQKKLYFALSMTIVYYLVESAPVNLGSLEFDNLDTDLKDLKYEVDDEDLENFSKLLEEADATNSANNDAKSNIKTSGFSKNHTTNNGLKNKYNIQDLKKFYKIGDLHDQGAYDDNDVYAVAKGIAAGVVEIDGNENRKYRKGTKTRGFHRVHHKDEYKKDKVFYEDDETNGAINKAGAKALGAELGAGAASNKGNFHHDHQKGIYGKKAFLDKGFLDKEFNGFSDSQGFDGSFASES